MEIDAETLISLIENRPAIYDYTMKEHHLRDFIDKLWEEIAFEVKATVAECKSKWIVLRNSFARALRTEKGLPSGSGSIKRKKWYLMDSMLFLKDFVGQHKKQDGNFAEINQESDSLNSFESGSSEHVVYDLIESPESSSLASTPKLRKKPTDVLMQPMLDFLKSKRVDENKESQHLLFFKSLIPDVEKLPPLHQRQFKEGVMSLLNQFLAANEEASL